MTLVVPKAMARSMKAHGCEGYPEEVCGVLLGRIRRPRGMTVRELVAVHRAGNLAQDRSSDRYLLDPVDYLNAEDEARNLGLEVIGVYHTHPDHPCAPSETDRQQAEQIWGELESWSYVIMEVTADGVSSWRSWVLRGGRFSEEEIQS
ncbi:MAG: M67 family metallopeptidase [Planctomycetes bacterium]|nr:M67 family metallopeptidase [Planctomycetota bacterium]